MSRENVLYVTAEPAFLTAVLPVQPGKVLMLNRYYRRLPAIREVVRAMRLIAARPGTIELLRFGCHGYHGGVMLWNERGRRLDLTHQNASVLTDFREMMAAGGRVEFHSCSTGSAFGGDRSIGIARFHGGVAAVPYESSPGQLFLQRVADALECPVTAAVYAEAVPNGVSFRGPTVTFRPRLRSE